MSDIDVMKIVWLCEEIRAAAKCRETKSAGTIMCAEIASKILRELERGAALGDGSHVSWCNTCEGRGRVGFHPADAAKCVTCNGTGIFRFPPANVAMAEMRKKFGRDFDGFNFEPEDAGDGWVKCSERMPEEGAVVDVCNPRTGWRMAVAFRRYEGRKWWERCDGADREVVVAVNTDEHQWSWLRAIPPLPVTDPAHTAHTAHTVRSAHKPPPGT